MPFAVRLLLAGPMLLLAGAVAAGPAEDVGNQLAISLCSDHDDGEQTVQLTGNWPMIFDTHSVVSGQYKTHDTTYYFTSIMGSMQCKKYMFDPAIGATCRLALVTRTGNELRRGAYSGIC
jgi:hypothetical protein